MKEKNIFCISIFLSFIGIIFMSMIPILLMMRGIGIFYDANLTVLVNKWINFILNISVATLIFLVIITLIFFILQKKKTIILFLACIILLSQYTFIVKPAVNNYSSDTIFDAIVIEKNIDECTITVMSQSKDNHTIILHVTNTEAELIEVGDIFDIMKYRTLTFKGEQNYLTSITLLE